MDKQILVQDQSGDGYYIAVPLGTKEIEPGNFIIIYKVKEYYHDLQSAEMEFRKAQWSGPSVT